MSATLADPRSEGIIATLHPRLHDLARDFVNAAAKAGITVKLISGLRTYNEQNALYAKGRTTPGKKVTNAPAGYSNHNFGIAFDIGIWKEGQYLDDSPLYRQVAPLAKTLGFEWGGDWKSFADEPHYQFRPGWATGMTEKLMLTELRRRKDSGRDFFA
jgi:peptidoglycan L-alanyl-D-glutamate endopeptidase CwlK